MDNEKEKRAQQKKNSWDMKQYIIIALVIFITFCCCTLFFFMIYRYNGFTDFWKNLGVILQPITIGIVIAYLLNPIMKFLEKHLIHFLKPRMKNGNKVKKTARAAAIAGSLLFLVMIVVLLLAAIIPSISQSIQSMVTKLPEEISNLSDWIDDVTNGNTEVSDMVEEAVKKGTDAIENFWQTDVLTKVQTYLTSITSGVIYGVKLVLNILIGLIISVYVMASKETFAGQAKKIIYAIFKPVRANIIVETVRKSNEIFGGFISGKILEFRNYWGDRLYCACNHEDAGFDFDRGHCWSNQYHTILWTIYRSHPILCDHCITGSDEGNLFSDLYCYFTADRWKYHRTKDFR